MTTFEIEKSGKGQNLVITDFRHGFLSEDETCIEVSITKKDAERLKKVI